MRMPLTWRLLMVVSCVALLGFCASSARADTINFGCNNQAQCGSTTIISLGGGQFKTAPSGISLTLASGPAALVGTAWILAFNTTTSGDNISITNGSVTLHGRITTSTPVGGGPTVLTLNVAWDILPDGGPNSFQTFLGTPTGIDATAITFDAGGNVTGTTSVIFPTPEPASLALLGSGLVMVGGFLRRRLRG